MFDYNDQIKDYHAKRIRIPEATQKTLRQHRKANQTRLKRNLPEGITVSDSDFVKQGSYANRTMTQHKGNDYDIDDGVIFKKEELAGEKGAEMSALAVRKMVEDALQDEKFDIPPERKVNCIRVHYKEGHHVDVPSYRLYEDANGNEVLEIAGADWRKSDPREINRWFESKAKAFNDLREGRSLQLRVMIRLLKRFCKSRDWNMPSGIILTMLTVNHFPDFERDDECFYHLLKEISDTLTWNLHVYNEADSDFPKEELTKSASDPAMVLFRDKIQEALVKLNDLHQIDCSIEEARKAWDWVFKTNGHFADFDSQQATLNNLKQKADLLKSGNAFTNSSGAIGTTGVANLAHGFYGEE